MSENSIAITFLVFSGKNLLIHDSIYFVPTLMVYERHLSKAVVFSGTQLSSDFLGSLWYGKMSLILNQKLEIYFDNRGYPKNDGQILKPLKLHCPNLS